MASHKPVPEIALPNGSVSYSRIGRQLIVTFDKPLANTLQEWIFRFKIRRVYGLEPVSWQPSEGEFVFETGSGINIDMLADRVNAALRHMMSYRVGADLRFVEETPDQWLVRGFLRADRQWRKEDGAILQFVLQCMTQQAHVKRAANSNNHLKVKVSEDLLLWKPEELIAEMLLLVGGTLVAFDID